MPTPLPEWAWTPVVKLIRVVCMLLLYQFMKSNMNPRSRFNISTILFLICNCSFVYGLANHDDFQHIRVRRSHNISDSCRKCYALEREHGCQQDVLLNKAKFYQSCGVDPTDQHPSESYECTRHENGTLCEVLRSRYFNNYNRDTYYNSYDPDPSGYCSSNSSCDQQCSELLQQLKNTWGCCFHSVINALHELTDYSIWNTCGIQPPESCSEPPDFNLEANDLADCFNKKQRVQLQRQLLCTPLSQQIKTSIAVNEANCGSYLRYIASLCAWKDKTSCYELMFYSYETEIFHAINEVCHRVSYTGCTQDCKMLLQSLHDQVGCCLHALTFHPTRCWENHDLERPGLPDSHWHSCGIEPPGLCPGAELTGFYSSTKLQKHGGYLLVHVSIVLYWLLF